MEGRHSIPWRSDVPWRAETQHYGGLMYHRRHATLKGLKMRRDEGWIHRGKEDENYFRQGEDI